MVATARPVPRPDGEERSCHRGKGTKKPSADLVSTLVVLIDHSTPEWMIAETARIPGTVVDHIGIM
jgi:hypothetical protein